MQQFYGRQQELNKLEFLTKKHTASLAVIKGRRRIGKSRLIEQFCTKYQHYIFIGQPPSLGFDGQQEREDFAHQLSRQLQIPTPRADDWGDLLWHLSDRVKKGRVVIVLDEINWLGHRDASFLGKLKSAWDLCFSKNPKLILILSGSLTGWIERNILHHTGFVGRISLDLTLKELPLADCHLFWKQTRQWSNYDKFKLLTITGGVPRYLEEILLDLDAEQNIRRMCFEPEGYLFNEFEQIFSDLFSQRNAIYHNLLELLINGPLELNDIYQALKVEKSGLIGEYLNDLSKAGFITRDYTWKINSGRESKLSRYRVSDNYLRFYLKYIKLNRRRIERDTIKRLPALDSILGLQFENLVLNNRQKLFELLGLDVDDIVYDNPFFQNKTLRQKGCQIDYMIQTRFNVLYIFEVKYHKTPISPTIITEVKEKVDRLLLPKNFSYRHGLIHVNGVSSKVIDSDFFNFIIDFSKFLNHS